MSEARRPHTRPALQLVSSAVFERGSVSLPSAPSPGGGSENPVLDDTELLASLGRGDRSAARAVYLRLAPVIDRTIVRLLGRDDREHEELAQLSFIETIRSIATFRGECSLDTWTSRVTAHVVYGELKRRRRDSMFLVMDGEDRLEVPSGDPEADAVRRSLLRRVRTHLERLDPVKAFTVVLHDVCGYDLREIAEITEVTVAAAQSRLVRGRAELHERIERDGELRALLSDSSNERRTR